MNSHKNARLTFARRVEMIPHITQRGVHIGAAALAHGVTPPTVRKWLGRFLALGEAGLAHASSRPAHSPRAIASSKPLAVVELRRRRLTQGRIAVALACKELGIRHKFTRPYRPQTNGKAERFIQSALREWAYGFTYQNSSDRTAALDYWNHHYKLASSPSGYWRPYSHVSSRSKSKQPLDTSQLAHFTDQGSCAHARWRFD